MQYKLKSSAGRNVIFDWDNARAPSLQDVDAIDEAQNGPNFSDVNSGASIGEVSDIPDFGNLIQYGDRGVNIPERPLIPEATIGAPSSMRSNEVDYSGMGMFDKLKDWVEPFYNHSDFTAEDRAERIFNPDLEPNVFQKGINAEELRLANSNEESLDPGRPLRSDEASSWFPSFDTDLDTPEGRGWYRGIKDTAPLAAMKTAGGITNIAGLAGGSLGHTGSVLGKSLNALGDVGDVMSMAQGAEQVYSGRSPQEIGMGLFQVGLGGASRLAHGGKNGNVLEAYQDPRFEGSNMALGDMGPRFDPSKIDEETGLNSKETLQYEKFFNENENNPLALDAYDSHRAAGIPVNEAIAKVRENTIGGAEESLDDILARVDQKESPRAVSTGSDGPQDINDFSVPIEPLSELEYKPGVEREAFTGALDSQNKNLQDKILAYSETYPPGISSIPDGSGGTIIIKASASGVPEAYGKIAGGGISLIGRFDHVPANKSGDPFHPVSQIQRKVGELGVVRSDYDAYSEAGLKSLNKQLPSDTVREAAVRLEQFDNVDELVGAEYLPGHSKEGNKLDLDQIKQGIRDLGADHGREFLPEAQAVAARVKERAGGSDKEVRNFLDEKIKQDIYNEEVEDINPKGLEDLIREEPLPAHQDMLFYRPKDTDTSTFANYLRDTEKRQIRASREESVKFSKGTRVGDIEGRRDETRWNGGISTGETRTDQGRTFVRIELDRGGKRWIPEDILRNESAIDIEADPLNELVSDKHMSFGETKKKYKEGDRVDTTDPIHARRIAMLKEAKAKQEASLPKEPEPTNQDSWGDDEALPYDPYGYNGENKPPVEHRGKGGEDKPLTEAEWFAQEDARIAKLSPEQRAARDAEIARDNIKIAKYREELAYREQKIASLKYREGTNPVGGLPSELPATEFAALTRARHERRIAWRAQNPGQEHVAKRYDVISSDGRIIDEVYDIPGADGTKIPVTLSSEESANPVARLVGELRKPKENYGYDSENKSPVEHRGKGGDDDFVEPIKQKSAKTLYDEAVEDIRSGKTKVDIGIKIPEKSKGNVKYTVDKNGIPVKVGNQGSVSQTAPGVSTSSQTKAKPIRMPAGSVASMPVTPGPVLRPSNAPVSPNQTPASANPTKVTNQALAPKTQTSNIPPNKPPAKPPFIRKVQGPKPPKQGPPKPPIPANKLRVFADVMNISRAVKTSYDFGALRNLKYLMFRPSTWRGVAEGLSAIKEGNAHAADLTLRRQPRFEIAESAKLGITSMDPNAPSHLREDTGVSKFTKNIPGVEVSNRIQGTALNHARMGVFDQLADSWGLKKGSWKDLSPDEQKSYKQIAAYVNSMSGRGNFGKYDHLATEISIPLFSARMQKSHLDKMAYAAKVFLPERLTGMDPRLRKEVIKDLGGVIAAQAALLYLAQASGVGKVEKDPRSSKFFQLETDNKLTDLSSGVRSWTVYLARNMSKILREAGVLLKGDVKDYNSEKFYKLDKTKDPRSKDMIDMGMQFARLRENPMVSLAHDTIRGRDAFGRKVGAGSVTERFTPMSAELAKDLLDDGNMSNALLWISSVMGMSDTEVSDKDYKRNKDKPKPMFESVYPKKFLKRHDLIGDVGPVN